MSRSSPRPSATGPSRHRGGQPHNTNAQKHGAYSAPAAPAATIDDAIKQLLDCQDRIAHALDENELDTETQIRAFGLMAANTRRLGRLLRDQRALSGQAADGIAGAIAQALDELSNELGQPL